MINVRIPATSANIGSGFDCLGLALGLHNYVSAEETDGGLKIEILDNSSKFLPLDEKNLIYRSMAALFDRVGYSPRGIHLVLRNNIMVTRGLGSSSAGIVGGLLAANELSGARLSNDELLNIAAEIEGHPDNVAPAILGGLTVNVCDGDKIKFVKADIPGELTFAAFVPNFFLSTKKARGILPAEISRSDAVYNIGRSALLFASIMTGKYENLRTAVDDKLHQQYRRALIPHMDEVFDKAYDVGAYGVYLSGAGPTIIAIINTDTASEFKRTLDAFLKEKNISWDLHMLPADNRGAFVF